MANGLFQIVKCVFELKLKQYIFLELINRITKCFLYYRTVLSKMTPSFLFSEALVINAPPHI